MRCILFHNIHVNDFSGTDTVRDPILFCRRYMIGIRKHGILKCIFQAVAAWLERQKCQTTSNHSANNRNGLFEKSRKHNFRQLNIKP